MPSGKAALTIGRYSILGRAGSEAGFFLETEKETRLFPQADTFEDSSSVPSEVTDIIEEASSVEYWCGLRTVLDRRGEINITYQRISLVQQAQIDELLER